MKKIINKIFLFWIAVPVSLFVLYREIQGGAWGEDGDEQHVTND